MINKKYIFTITKEITMKKLILAIFLFATSLTFSQSGQFGWTLSQTIDTAGAGLNGTTLLLPDLSVPVAVWVDTLTDASNLELDVFFGDTSGFSDSSEQMLKGLTELENGALDWSATLTDGKTVPLDPFIMQSLLGQKGYKPSQVWIRPRLTVKQDQPIVLSIRVRRL
jgi:hypothetical protein